MKNILYIIALASGSAYVNAQTLFLGKGKIEFEKIINVHKLMEGGGTWAEEMRSRIPQFRKEYYDFSFTGNKSVYKAGKEGDDARNFFTANTKDNIIFNDYQEKRTTTQKVVFDQTYLILDSLRKLKWRVTGDRREIAGFNCRRATAIIMDSVFVVAFYTDEILVPGGPESITGLPGMILGLVIPRMHTTWYATKVDVVSMKENEIVPPVKGKKSDNAAVFQAIKKGTADWQMEDKYIWPMIL